MKKILFYFVVALCCSHLVYAAITEYTIKKVYCERCSSSSSGSATSTVTNRANSWQNARNNVIPSGLTNKCTASGTTVTCDIRDVDEGRRYYTMEDCINSRNTEMSESTAECVAVTNGGVVLQCKNGYTWQRYTPDQGGRACYKEHTITFSDPLAKDFDEPYNPNQKVNIGVLPTEYNSYCTVKNINGTSFDCEKTDNFWNTDRCETYKAKKNITSAAATCTASEYVPTVTLTCKNGLNAFNKATTEANGHCVYRAAYKWADAAGTEKGMGDVDTTADSLYMEAQDMTDSGTFPSGTTCTYNYDTNTIVCSIKDFLSMESCLADRNSKGNPVPDCIPSGDKAPDGTELYEQASTRNSVESCDEGLKIADDGTSCQVK